MYNAIQRNPYTIGLVSLALLLALWIPTLFFFSIPVNFGATTPMMPLQSWLINDIGLQGRSGMWASFIFISFSVCLLFMINRRHLFVTGHEQFMLLLFILFSSSITETQQFSGSQAATVFTLISIFFLFNTIQKINALPAVFLSSFFIATASLFYFPSIIILIALLIGVLISKPFAWRDWAAYITGITAPYLYLFLYYYLTKGSYTVLGDIITENIPLLAILSLSFSWPEYCFIILLSLIVLWSLLPLRSGSTLTKIKTTRMRQIIRCLLFCLVATVFLFQPAHFSMMPLLSIPMAIIIADYYDNMKHKKLFITLLIFLCITIITMKVF
jgi:hypothetical protein